MVGSETSNWEDIIPGRCEHLLVPLPPHGFVSVCVVDAPAYLEARSPFAVLLVPRGQELDWMFCTPNGLWDLLFSSSVSRLVVLRRTTHPVATHEEENREKPAICIAHEHTDDPHQQALSRVSPPLGISHTYPFFTQLVTADDHDDDESFKKLFTPLLSSLFPWSLCPLGPTPDLYVTYEDNVQDRLVVETRHSEALGSDILVEDIELARSTEATEAIGTEPKMRELRRRMRFQQMPNLIQTEVLVAIYKNGCHKPMYGLQDVKLLQQRHGVTNGLEKGTNMQSRKVGPVYLEVRPDHSKLVHKYLPPIVAGLILASPCLEACIEADTRPRFLTIGLGGGALPFFLHKRFGFSVLAVDTDETVVELAHQYFGFVENEHLQAQVKDGVQVLYSLVHQVCRNCVVSNEIMNEWQEASKDFDQEILMVSGCADPRMHGIVVDVSVSDACLGIVSPPPCFLTKAFLLAVRLVLHEGGMLVINVIPRAEHNLLFVVNSLRKVFTGIYRIRNDDNHVLFIFPFKVADISMSSSFALLVAHAVGEGWFNQIEEVE